MANKNRKRALLSLLLATSICLSGCAPTFTLFKVDSQTSTVTENQNEGDVMYPESEDIDGMYTDVKNSSNKPSSGKTYDDTIYLNAYGIKADKGVKYATTPISFSKLGLKRPSVIHPAEVHFGTYQNMDQLAYNPNEWAFCRAYGDGILFHEAYWLNMSSPIATEGKALGDIIKTAKNLKVYLEYGMPKASITATAEDNGTIYGKENADYANYRINRFMDLSGINIDVVNLEFYSGSVTNIMKALGLEYSWDHHYNIGVPYLLKTYDSFYERFVKDFPGMQINHVGCPNLTGWVSEADGGTLPRHWQQNYTQPYWTSYQAYDITIPIFEKYKNDGLHLGWVHDSSWLSFDKGGNNVYGTQDAVVLESMDIIQNRFNMDSTLIVGSWDGGSGNTVETGGRLLNESHDDADRYFWENSLKSIYNAQYHGEMHNAYLIESYWDGPYQMVPETQKYTYTNLVQTAIKYLKGIGQNLDLYITDSKGKKTGEDVYLGTPSAEQTVKAGKKANTYTITLKNNGDVDCNPWLRAVENKNGAKVTYTYKGKDITDAITSKEGYMFKDLFENENGEFDLYTTPGDHVLNTRYDEQPHGLKPGESISIEVTVSGGNDGAVAICGFYNMQDITDTIKDVVTIKF